MSRVGKLPVIIPQGVTVTTANHVVTVVGPKGTIERVYPREIEVSVNDNQVNVTVKKETDHARAMHGTVRAHIANMVKGVSEGWSKQLELVGTGYRSEVRGDTLVLTVGYSNPVEMKLPHGVNAKVEKSIVTLDGYDKEVVSLFADKVHDVRPPEPYNGKGIKYVGEIIRRKAGKAAKGAA
jgi:large subunit ribosomal protein L6